MHYYFCYQKKENLGLNYFQKNCLAKLFPNILDTFSFLLEIRLLISVIKIQVEIFIVEATNNLYRFDTFEDEIPKIEERIQSRMYLNAGGLAFS